jgi:hypothetical protein
MRAWVVVLAVCLLLVSCQRSYDNPPRLVVVRECGRVWHVPASSSAGVPEPAAREFASYGRAIREGHIDQISGAVENLTGRPPRSLRQVFEAHRDELLQGVSA